MEGITIAALGFGIAGTVLGFIALLRLLYVERELYRAFRAAELAAVREVERFRRARETGARGSEEN